MFTKFLVILICLNTCRCENNKYDKSTVQHIVMENKLLPLNEDTKAESLVEDIKFIKPTINICCKTHEYLRKNKCQTELQSPNHKIKNVTFPDIYTNDLQLSSVNPWLHFDIRFRNPCKGQLYSLDPPTDTFYLLENGTVYQNDTLSEENPHLFHETNKFCLVNIFVGNDTESTSKIGVCFGESLPDPKIKNKQAIYYPIAMSFSALFLLMTFFVYSCLPDLRNIHGVTVMSYVVCLFFGYVAIVVVQIGDRELIKMENLCTLVAFTIHFSFLASFFWLNVMCFDIWWTFGGFRSLAGSVKQREKKKFIFYSLYAWGSASILTGICLIMDFVPEIPDNFIKPRFGVGVCWFVDDVAKAIYFYGPMGITVICNIILFISTALKIRQHKKDTAHHLKGMDSRRHDDNKQWFNLYLKLFIVMGINWSLEIISWLVKDKYLDNIWLITDLANTLQGVIIFIIFVWKDKIKRLLLKKIGWQNRNSQSRNSTRNHSSTSRTVTSTMTPLQDKTINLQYKDRICVTTDESDCL